MLSLLNILTKTYLAAVRAQYDMLGPDTFRYLQWPRFQQDGAHPKCLILVMVTDWLRTAPLLQKLHSWVCHGWELELIKGPQHVAPKDEEPVCSVYICTMQKGQSWSIRRVATTYPRHRVWKVAITAGRILPLLTGCRCFMHPNPSIYKTKNTVGLRSRLQSPHMPQVSSPCTFLPC